MPVLLAVLASAAHGGSPGETVKESGRLTGHVVRDGAKTVGRTIRSFFTRGPHAAKRTWHANASHTDAQLHADEARVRDAAR